jgi:UDPglucose--hexose-1-phosphate uridylyltransferase
VKGGCADSTDIMTDPILNDISHRRFNLLRGSWILVSPHRTKRPWQYVLMEQLLNSLTDGIRGMQESPSKTTLPEYDDKVGPGSASPKI